MLLENPCGDGIITQHGFRRVIQKMFGFTSSPAVFSDSGKTKPVTLNGKNLSNLNGSTVYV